MALSCDYSTSSHIMGAGVFMFFQTEVRNTITVDTDILRADELCWTADGLNCCLILKGGSGYPVPTVIVYETVPKKTIQAIVEKASIYKKTKKNGELSKDAQHAIVEALVDTWETEDMIKKMAQYNYDKEQAMEVYRNTLYQLLREEEELALILILASV